MTVNLRGWSIQGSSKQISLHFRLGEASRGVVLLLGMVLVLGERRKVVTLLAFALLPALLMVALGLLIQNSFTDLLVRLFIGGLAYLVCLGFAVGLLLPNVGLSVLNRVRKTLRVSWELS